MTTTRHPTRQSKGSPRFERRLKCHICGADMLEGDAIVHPDDGSLVDRFCSDLPGPSTQRSLGNR